MSRIDVVGLVSKASNQQTVPIGPEMKLGTKKDPDDGIRRLSSFSINFIERGHVQTARSSR